MKSADLIKRREEIFPQKSRKSVHKGESRGSLLKMLEKKATDNGHKVSKRSIQAWESGQNPVPRWVEKELES